MLLKAILIFFVAFVTTAVSMPSIVKVATKRSLFDEPKEPRKIHTRDISNLGGIGIFLGFFFCVLLFQIICDSRELGSLAAASVLLFFIAFRDDLVPSSPLSRLLFQFIIAGIIVFVGQVHFVHITVFEANTLLKEVVNIIFSFIFIVGFINAFNFIDGIDGLAGSLGLFSTLVFASLFLWMGDLSYGMTALALAGGILGFLIFNFGAARIFMGDMGSMLIGVFLAIFGIRFANAPAIMQDWFTIAYPGSIIFAILIVPIMDMITVISIRLYFKQSPFIADKRHLHHRMLGLGWSHAGICLFEVFFNALVILLALALQKSGSTLWPCLAIVVSASFVEVFFIILYMRKQGKEAQKNLSQNNSLQK